MRNGSDAAATDGCRQFPPGTRAEDIVACYATLLSQHGWTAGRDFVASGTSLHFYGISELGGGSADSRLGVYGATDSAAVPYREVAPARR